MKEVNKFVDQLIVRVGKACNFKCSFCNVGDNEKLVKQKETYEDIVRNFLYKFRYSNTDSGELLVTISGGEPSLFKKETIFALKYIQSFLEKRSIQPIFDIQTNASSITPGFAKQLKEHGVYLALISFHTNDRDIFNKIIQIDYDTFFPKIVEGIHILHDAGILVDVNIVLNKHNYVNFTDNIHFLLKEFPFIDTYNIGFVQPHGHAVENFDDLFVQYSTIAPIYNQGIALLDKNGKKIMSHFVGLPVCFLDDPSYSIEFEENIHFRKGQRVSLEQKNLINNINDDNKTQASECSICKFNNVCSGIWKEYEGKQKLQPQAYLKFFEIGDQNISIFDETLVLKNKNIAEYESLVPSVKFALLFHDNIDKKDIIQHSLFLLSEGYYKIGIYFEKGRKIDLEYLLSGATNFQCYISDIDTGLLKNIIDFSVSHKPQFGINVDIIVDIFGDLLLLEKVMGFLHVFTVKIYVLKDPEVSIGEYEKFFEKHNLLEFKNSIFTVDFLDEFRYQS